MDFTEGLKAVLKGRDAVTMRGAYGVELFAKRLKNDELALSMRGANGWELLLITGGPCEYSRVLFDCVAETVATMLRDEAQKAAQAAPVCETVNVSAAPQNAAQAATAPRCAHFKSIKRAYAIATKAGLNVKADAAMRSAFSAFLCKPVASRETLNGSDWEKVGTAIKRGELTW
jgi:hypothetical protein